MSEDKDRESGLQVKPKTGIRTDMTTLVAIIVASFVCGGFLMSLKYDMAAMRSEMATLRSLVYTLLPAKRSERTENDGNFPPGHYSSTLTSSNAGAAP